MTAADATRLAGDAYSTRLARDVSATTDDKTRLAQEGYESKLARDAVGVQPDADEFYKIGDKIGDRYEVAAIHHGAMGVVYGCFDHQTKLPRALKTVRARYAHDKQVLSLFENEAAVWISLEKHPYIVRAYLIERFKNLPYVITEYVRGPEGMEGDLRGWLGHPRLTLPVAVAMALQIAQGMQHAVRKVPNLVHRDLKPANILVNGDGKAMVTDFGLVHAAQSGAGTPAYMSPEQWRKDALDARSDIYAYGCILFEMFTAHRLFPAVTEREWEHAHLESTPISLTSLVPGLPREIDRFVLRCLAKKEAARPQSWDEIVTFFAEWYHRLTGKAVVLDFSSLALDAAEWLTASYSLANLKRYEETLLACDRALVIDQNNATAWYNKGTALSELKRNEEAIQAFDRALAINPNYVTAWYNKGNALSELKCNEEAIQAFDRALVIDPNYVAAWYNKGNALLNLKRYDEAIQAYDQALVIDPNHVVALSNKGNALGNLKRYDEAIQAYDQALAIDPNDAVVWNNKGSALGELKRNEESIQACDRALAIYPNYVIGIINKGNALLKLTRYDEAIQAYDQALAIDPNHAFVWTSKGDALRKLNRNVDAIQAYDRALAIDQNKPDTWHTKGDALVGLNRFAEAIMAYDRALAIDQKDLSAWYNKGKALQDLKRYEEAILAYDQALVLDPQHFSAWYGKGFSLRSLKRFEESIQAFNRALAIDQNATNAWVNKGFTLLILNRYQEANQACDQAIQTCDKALASPPILASAWCYKGSSLHGLKRYTEAIQAYDRALALDATYEFAFNQRKLAVDALHSMRRPRVLGSIEATTIVTRGATHLPTPSFPGTDPLFVDDRSNYSKEPNKFSNWIKLVFGAGCLIFIGLLLKLTLYSNPNTATKQDPPYATAPTYSPSQSKRQPTIEIEPVSYEEALGSSKPAQISKSRKTAKHNAWGQDDPRIDMQPQIVSGKFVPFDGELDKPHQSAKRPLNGYLKGDQQTFADGLSSFTVDNRTGSHDAETRLYVNGVQVRSMFVRVGTTFTAKKLAPGTYRMRYKMTIDGKPRAFEAKEDFVISQTEMAAGTRFSRVRVTLYAVKDGNMQTEEIPLGKF